MIHNSRIGKLFAQEFRLAAIAMIVTPCSLSLGAETTVDFEKQIAPIFVEHCIRCHTPGNKKGNLSLATGKDLQESGHVAKRDPEGSYLLYVVLSHDGNPPEMPKNEKPLTSGQTELLRRWISEGALWPDAIRLKEKPRADASWWAYQPLKADTSKTIDDYISDKLAAKGLKRNPPSSRRTLIRRATYDLTGLPPTPDDVAAFTTNDDPLAYEKLIDRLLASPRYGERWGRHWLDVVRFGESNGFERNVIINSLWPFRDYVIQSINDDKPFNQLIREHIAGDVMAPDDFDTAVGSAFLVAGPYDDVGNQDPAQAAQIRANTLDEIISATGQAFLGMTIGCARCHDHKFDPITQEDYYALYSTFSGVRHGEVPLASKQAIQQRSDLFKPLYLQKTKLEVKRQALEQSILKRAKSKLAKYESQWTRLTVDRTRTEDRFTPVTAKFIRLICDAQDTNPNSQSGFRIDEFEIWSSEAEPRNVALAKLGGSATGASRRIEDFPGAYGPQLAIDGKIGARFIAANSTLTIELATPTKIDRVVFSSAKGETKPEHRKFIFVAEYRIESSLDGQSWKQVSSGYDRKPIPGAKFLNRRLLHLETTDEDRLAAAQITKDLAEVNRQIAQVPSLPYVWIGKRVAADAKGPFHVFLGGNPLKKGKTVVPASLSVLKEIEPASYILPGKTSESERRLAFANWIVHEDNPVTPRVLANRIWHYHFGTGIVDTPNDFGYMGGRPSHPELLDLLAIKLKENHWQLKDMHRMIMLSKTYRQSSRIRADGVKNDSHARLLWRFPPRRLSAEEIRDTILQVSGNLKETLGGPGFRLYKFMQDNVCTYVPLDQHGPETYRRAVYHQNARASVVDLMTDFDQPDCAFSVPKRAKTTTPLQALTMLNHQFTLDMADSLSKCEAKKASDNVADQIRHLYELCYGRPATRDEIKTACEFVAENGLAAFCRVLLNTSELIYVR